MRNPFDSDTEYIVDNLHIDFLRVCVPRYYKTALIAFIWRQAMFKLRSLLRLNIHCIQTYASISNTETHMHGIRIRSVISGD